MSKNVLQKAYGLVTQAGFLNTIFNYSESCHTLNNLIDLEEASGIKWHLTEERAGGGMTEMFANADYYETGGMTHQKAKILAERLNEFVMGDALKVYPSKVLGVTIANRSYVSIPVVNFSKLSLQSS